MQVAGVLGAAVLGALYYFQDKLLYFPGMPPGAKENFFKPVLFGFKESDWEEVFFRTKDNVKIQSWLFKRGEKGVATLVFFHGNAGNLSHRLENIRKLFSLGVNVLIVSYRGYGKSEGTPSEKGIKLDAQAALHFLSQREDLDPSKLILFGRSLGGAVAAFLAHHSQKNHEKEGKGRGGEERVGVKGVILENTFTSVPEMLDVVFPALSPLKFLVSNEWNTLKLVGEIECPILFLSGEKDQLVPNRMMRKLYQLSKDATFVTFPSGTHMDLPFMPNYYNTIHKWILKLHL